MRIALAGPVAFDTFRTSLKVALEQLPRGGRETPINPLAIQLMQRGHDVHVITLDADIEAPIRVAEAGLTFHALPRRRRARDIAVTLFGREIRALVRAVDEIRPDIVHGHWTYEYAEAAVRAAAPHLVTMHDSPLQILRFYRDPYRFFRLVMALRTLPRVRGLTVVSPYLERHARLHGYRGKVRTIANGIEIPSGKLAAHVRKPIKIATIGDTGRRKNVAASVEAFAAIRRHMPDAELHLFGPGLDAAFARSQPRVYGHGAVSHSALMDFLSQQATLVIHPSHEESFGVILVEAMARGVPCIAGRKSGGVSFVVGQALGRLLVDVRRPDAIAECAIRVLGSLDEYREAQCSGLSRAAQFFDQRAIALEYERAYIEEIGRGARKCPLR